MIDLLGPHRLPADHGSLDRPGAVAVTTQAPGAGVATSKPPPLPLVVTLDPGRTAVSFAGNAPRNVADDAALAALLARLSARLATAPERQPVKVGPVDGQ